MGNSVPSGRRIADTVALAEARTDADLSSFREELTARRRAIDPPAG